MEIFLTTLLLGISLSMDAFSLAIFLGTINTKNKNKFFILIVGIFHFIMPILGAVIGYKLNNILKLNGEIIFATILLMLSMQILLSLKKDEEVEVNLSFYQLIMIAFGVSIDSLTIGFGLSIRDSFMITSSVIFSICSMFFTYVGILIGKYFNKKIGIYSKIIGAIMLFTLALIILL
ncbi:MAG: manganese efflux pump [bacterium]